MTRDEILNMPAGREIDALIEENIFKSVSCNNWAIQRYYPEEWIRINSSCEHERCHPLGFVPRYSTDISAAWEVVEKFVEQDCKCHIYRYGNWNKKDGKRCWQVFLGDNKYNLFPYAEADTAPLAICRAALLAISKG